MKKINNNKIYFYILIFISIVIIPALLQYIYHITYEGFDKRTTDAVEKDTSDKKIGVIYFAFLKEDRWRTIVLPQMHDLAQCGLAKNADIDIVLSGTEKEITSAKSEITNILSPVNNNVHFDYSYENTYEYPGIKKLYNKAEENPEKIYLYFHSKGMVFYKGEPRRNNIEIYLFENLIKNWETIVDIFEKNPHKNKVSLGCSMEGVCWFNFFWVRGAYLKRNCSIPKIATDRFYYESYISTDCKNSSYKDCYNSADNNEKPYYHQPDIVNYLREILGKLD